MHLEQLKHDARCARVSLYFEPDVSIRPEEFPLPLLQDPEEHVMIFEDAEDEQSGNLGDQDEEADFLSDDEEEEGNEEE